MSRLDRECDNVMIDVAGGEENDDKGPTADILKYDPSTESWARTGEMMNKRWAHTLSEVKWSVNVTKSEHK